MSDTEILVPQDDDRASRSTGSRVLGWLAALLAVVVVLVLFMHVFAPPIASGEAPPPAHPRSMCVMCHIVTGS